MKDCPVCGKTGLADRLTECPQCNADLQCFDLLDTLYEEAAGQQPYGEEPSWTKQLERIRADLLSIRNRLERFGKNRWVWRYAVLSLTVIALGGVILFQDFAFERRLDEKLSRLSLPTVSTDAQDRAALASELIGAMEALSHRLKTAEEKLVAISANQEAAYARLSATLDQVSNLDGRFALLEQALSRSPPAVTAAVVPEAVAAADSGGQDEGEIFYYHEPQPGESLWDIARQYYGDGRFYPVLLEYNPGLGIYYSRDYGKIKVLRDPQRAKAVLEKWVSVGKKGTLFQYKVIDGDSWSRISRRFFGHGDKVAMLKALNPHARLVPGERVSIPLQ
jgi:hypothetical protein